MRRGSVIALGLTGLGLLACLGVAAGSSGAQTGRSATLLGVSEWDVDAPWFQGQSGLSVSPDGSRAVVIGDRGTRLDIALHRRDGRIERVEILSRAGFRDRAGAPLQGGARDAEGVARLPDGRICVSFEGVHRIRCYTRKRGPAQPLPPIPRPVQFPINHGIEALAADDAGRIYAIPELTRDQDGYVPVYRFDGTKWSVILRLPARGRFRPVGADIVGDDLYLLERAVSPLGFNSRLVRLSLTHRSAETLLETGPGRFDNLEGLSLWRDPSGRLIATMISDDNNNWFQTTQFVELAISE
ncbi:MAG: esterase-like activity of phytase family protein [Marinibacterium sp.]